MESITLLAVFAAIALFGSEWLSSRSITMPIIFVLGGFILGGDVLGWIHLEPEIELIFELTELTLALLLFSDASTIPLKTVRAGEGLESRLLGLGLPLTIAAGGLAAYLLFPDENLGVMLLIGAALAPTDAALGLPIFRNPHIPERIRQSLNVESGLNDGLVTPFVALFTAYAIAEGVNGSGSWLSHSLREIGIGISVGIVFGLVGGYFLRQAKIRGMTSEVSGQIAFFAICIATFFGARELEGNGFIAAFVGGLALGWVMKEASSEFVEFTETAGTGLSLMVWTVFGAVFLPLAIDEAFSWRVVIYAVLSITVVRMIPVAISLINTHESRSTVAVMGWFGPRGLASLVFLTGSLISLEAAGEDVTTLVGTMAWTISLSVLLHGITAGPVGRWYESRLTRKTPLPQVDG